MCKLLLISTFGLWLTSSSAFAHHPFSADYDANKPITLKGIVTKVDWVAPHPMVHLDVAAGGGQHATWVIELGDMDALAKNGWKPNSAKPGDRITVEGWQAKNGGKRANAKSMTLPGGPTLSAASSHDANTRGQLASTPQRPGAGTSGQVRPRTAAAEPTRSAADVITVLGCVQRETEYRSEIADGKGGVAGTGVGASNEFVLRSLQTVSNDTFKPTGTSGVSPNEVYSLTGNLEHELQRALGKQVAVSGYVEVARSQGTEKVRDLPRLNAAGWHLVSDQCPQRATGR